jgi:peroxiredoxin
MIYLAKRTISGSFVVDSVLPEKSGKYLLKGYTKQPDFYAIYHHPGAYINLVINPGDDFRILTDAATFDRNYLVEGSADSRLIQKMVNMQIRTLEKITQLSEEYENSRNSADLADIRAEIDSAYERVFSEHRNFSIQLITENPHSLATLMTLYQQLGRNTAVFDYKRDFRYYEMVDSNLSPLYPNSEAVIDLNKKVTELREILRFEKGSPAPDLSIPDPDGKQIKLSSLKGKFTVLFFWASWSSRSLNDLTRLESLYKDLKGEVEYYQVSIDRTRESWLQHITQSGIHVSDLKYWDSPVVQTYHIQKLPVIYLLDKSGNIIAKDFEPEKIRDLIY